MATEGRSISRRSGSGSRQSQRSSVASQRNHQIVVPSLGSAHAHRSPPPPSSDWRQPSKSYKWSPLERFYESPEHEQRERFNAMNGSTEGAPSPSDMAALWSQQAGVINLPACRFDTTASLGCQLAAASSIIERACLFLVSTDERNSSRSANS